MNLNELLDQIDDVNIERESSTIKIINLKNKFYNQDIVINTNRLGLKNPQGGPISVNVKDIYFANCTFKSMTISTHIGLENLHCHDDVIIDDISIANLKLNSLKISGTFTAIKLENSQIDGLSLRSKNKIQLIDIKKSKIERIEIRIIDIKTMRFHKLVDCKQLVILGDVVTSQNTSAVIEYFSMKFCSNIEHIYVSKLFTPFHIKNFHISDFNNVNELELNSITIDSATILSRTSYNNLKVSFSNIQINKYISMNNIDFGKSVFKNLNLSKCLFNNSLISKSLFYECKVDKIPDIPLMKFKKIAFVFIFFIPVLIAIISINFTGLWKENLIFALTSMLPYIFAFLIISFLLFFYKHVATLDEGREKYKKHSTSKLKTILMFLKSAGKSLKNFFWKMDEQELYKLQEIESLNRQLKVAFEASKDSQNANEFIYSEMLMKIRQKNIWMNLISVDFWNYLINGFGRRWRRALMNFVIVFVIAVIAFMNSVPFQFVVKDKAPEFILEANQTVFEAIPKDLGIGLISSIEINNDVNTTQESNNTDGIVIISNLLDLSSIYTLSKIDIFKVKTNGWFEETSSWNFLKANVIGLVLLFLLGAFALAFKRRLDK